MKMQIESFPTISSSVDLKTSYTILPKSYAFLKIMVVSILMVLQLHAIQVCCLSVFTGCNIIEGLDDRLTYEGKAPKDHATVRLCYSHIKHTVSCLPHTTIQSV